MTQPKRPRPRVGLKELKQLDQIFQVHTPELTMGKRISTRLRFKDKLKAFSSLNHRTQASQPNRPLCCGRINLATESIDRRDPADKILFLRILGLSPTFSEDSKGQFVEAETEPISTINDPWKTSTCTQTFDNYEEPAATTTTSVLDAVPGFCPKNEKIVEDEEEFTDLDLELVFCPLDIPEIYEEITKKPFPKSTTQDVRQNPEIIKRDENYENNDVNNTFNCENSHNESINCENEFISRPPKTNETKSTAKENSGPKRLRRQLSCMSNNQDSNSSPVDLSVKNCSQKFYQNIVHNVTATDYLQEVKSRLCLLGTDLQVCVSAK